jgi:hypothetical protein
MASGCATCGLRARAEKSPDSWWAKLWRWHTTWCPGWKAYQRELAAEKAAAEQAAAAPAAGETETTGR